MPSPMPPAARLRQAGLKVTGPRLAILEELGRNRTHPVAEEIHRQLRAAHPSLSVSTVYLTLEAFVKAGLARRLPPRDGRMRVDGTMSDHDHATCRGCGAIFDLPRKAGAVKAPSGMLPRGAAVLDARVEYDILCAPCRRAQAPRDRAAGRAGRTSESR